MIITVPWLEHDVADGERHRVISYYNRDHVLHLYKDVIGEGYDKIIAERFGSTSIPTADASTTPANPAPPRIMLKTPSMSPTLTALAIDGTVNFKALLAQSISSDNFGRPKQPTPFGNANARAASSRSSISVANIEVEGGKRRRAGTKVKTYAEEDDDFEDEEEYRVAVRPRGAEKQQQQQQQQQKQQQIQLHDQQQLRQSMQGYGMHPGQGGYFDGQQFHMQQHGRPPMSPFEFSPHQQHGGGYGSLRQTYPSQHFAARQDSFPDQQNLQQHHQPQLPPFFSQREAESRWHQGHTSLAVSSRPGSMTQPRSNPSHIHTSHQQQEQQQYQQNQQAFSQPMSASGNFSLPSRHFSQNGPSQPQTLMTHTRSVYLQSITPSSSLLRAPSTLPHQPPLRYEPIHQHDLATLRQSDRVPSAFIRRDDCQPTTGWKNSPGMGAPQFSYHGQHVHPVLEQRRPFTPPTPQHITPPGYSTLQQHQQ
ncbi:hypothetical protein BC830DRAFT_709117 [Chytriomyces sp. MP71]|nr:hypothetical protein BC830DRAFT_709117 [Chytriomyces sp. MP71]